MKEKNKIGEGGKNMNVKCREVQEKLSLYLDGMLPDKEREQIKSHLYFCEECRSEFDTLLELHSLLADMPQASLPKDFDQNLRYALENPGRMIPLKKGYKRYGAVAAMFVIMAVTVVSLSLSGLDKTDSDPTSKLYSDTGDSLMSVYDDKNAGPDTAGGASELGKSNLLAAQDEIQSNPSVMQDSGGVTPEQIEPNSLPEENSAELDSGELSSFMAAEGLSLANESRIGAGDASQSVMEAAYGAGAESVNDALDFVSLIADSDVDGLKSWLVQHTTTPLSEEEASQLASEYYEKYKVESD